MLDAQLREKPAESAPPQSKMRESSESPHRSRAETYSCGANSCLFWRMMPRIRLMLVAFFGADESAVAAYIPAGKLVLCLFVFSLEARGARPPESCVSAHVGRTNLAKRAFKDQVTCRVVHLRAPAACINDFERAEAWVSASKVQSSATVDTQDGQYNEAFNSGGRQDAARSMPRLSDSAL